HGRGSCPWDRAVLRRAGPPHAGVAGRRQTNEASGPASEGRPTVPTVLDGFLGAPERIRTPGLLIRSQTLYPAELRARGAGPASVPANKDSTACRTACKAGATRRREVVPVRGGWQRLVPDLQPGWGSGQGAPAASRPRVGAQALRPLHRS